MNSALVVEAREVSGAALLAVSVRRAATTRHREIRALPPLIVVREGIRADPERLAAYAQLVGEPVRDELPAGFVHVLTFPVVAALLTHPGVPLPLLGLVHLANRVEHHRAIGADEPLGVTVHLEALRAHRRGAVVDVVAEVSADDAVVWRGVSTYLAKGAVAGGATTPVADHPTFVPPTPTGLWRLPRDVGRRYAAVSGDHNPIHTSVAAARAFGFPRPIAHGMFTAARALADVGVARGGAYAWDVEFASPVLLPSTVSVRVAPDDAGHTFVGWSRSGRLHLTGSVRPLA